MKIQSTNPGRNYELIGEIEQSTPEEVAAAIATAKTAFPAWRDLGPEGRKPYFDKFIAAFTPRVDEIAELQSSEMGKPLSESKGEVESLIGWLQNQLAIAPAALAAEVVDSFDDYELAVHREPFGVVAAIAPWNYPTFQFALAVLPQLIAGNTVVFKHSEECILTSKLLADIMAEAGFPDGVFATVYGDGTVGESLTGADVDFIHFTGSTKVGRSLYKVAAEQFIPAVLEMGGSSPGIVFADAALEETCLSVFGERNDNAGQVCSALKRLFVEAPLYDDVVAKLVAIAQEQVIGDAIDEKTTMGPLVAKRQLEALERQVADAVEKGAVIVCGGKRVDGLEGAYYEPTILTNVTNDMAVMTEEVFGPVLPVVSFATETEAVEKANDTEYGLSAFVYTTDLEKADRVVAQLQSGQISINGKLFFTDNAPFGGYKKSGIGRGDGKLGYQYITQLKTIARPKS